jgi:para-nitrobenzyl esterase
MPRKASGMKPWQVLSAILTEAVFRKPVGRIADGHANHGGEAYVYRFDWRPTPQARLGACHMIEVPFVFDNLPNWPAAPMLAGCDPSSFTKLATIVQSNWLSFIRTGKPGGSGLAIWPSRNAAHPQCLVFDQEVHIVDDANVN